MDLALYHPTLGYYTRAAQRSGRAGDFFTSVDVGSTFGELLERQIAEMADLMPGPFDLVEAGAGSGRLSADILCAARERHPTLHARTRLHLVESSPAARAAQPATLGEDASRLASSSDSLPVSFTGVLFANELLDAMPVHEVVRRSDGLREVYVHATTHNSDGRPTLTLATQEGPLSTDALETYLDRAGVTLEVGWRADISLRAVEWVRDAARRLTRGFLVFIDYGHEAGELFSAAHAGGSLTTFWRHSAAGPEDAPAWLARPGQQDITSHVDFTSVRGAAEAEGLQTVGLLDQTYFLLGLIDRDALDRPASSVEQIKRRLALKTLMMPGGLGSTMKVLILARHMGTPSLSCCAHGARLT